MRIQENRWGGRKKTKFLEVEEDGVVSESNVLAGLSELLIRDIL